MIAYFDMFSGISGDMTLGALVDLGVPVDWLKKQFENMPLPDAEIRAEDIWHNGIKGVNLFVEEKSGSLSHSHGAHHVTELHALQHESHHYNNNHHHHHHHNGGSETEDGHPKTAQALLCSRNYNQIKKLIADSPFSEYVKSSSLKAFEKIAIAESGIHGTPVEKVHFHEVGGVDAIVDIVGAFLSVEYLGITKIYGSTVFVGKGKVKCSHGIIPVPAPATLKILKGVPVRASDCDMELVTPTGAAIITTLTQEFGEIPDMVIGDTGYGAGKRKSLTGLPNLLRIITGEPIASDTVKESINENIFKETVYVLETSIDDMNPEIAGYLMEKLFEKGALDVSYTPLQMKKNRPAFRLEVICRKVDLDSLIEIILTESTSSGIRFYETKRAILARRNVQIQTSFGKIGAKIITDPKGEVRTVPEYEVCRKIALEHDIPLRDVYSKVMQSASCF